MAQLLMTLQAGSVWKLAMPRVGSTPLYNSNFSINHAAWKSTRA